MGLGSILGAAAGLLIPGGGALTAALGSGIGSLLEGDDPKDAIRNAVLAGVGAKVFPNVAEAIKNSQLGMAATRGIGSLGIGTQDGLAALRSGSALAPAQSIIPVPRPSNLGQAAAGGGGGGGIFGDMNLGTASALLTLGGGLIPQEVPEYDMGNFGQSLNIPLDTTNLYYNQYTGEAFDSKEERDQSEERYLRELEEAGLSYGSQFEVGSDQYTQVNPNLSYPTLRPYREGGLIEGPGTVTSDSIPGMIMQNGRPVEQIAVSNGEVILSGKDLAGLDPDGDMERAARKLDSVPNGYRGKMAAKMYADMMSMRS